MVQNNFSDLLQEQVQKFSPTEGEAVIDVAATPDNPPTSSDIAREGARTTPDTGVQEESTQAAANQQLEATVKELQAALAQAQQNVAFSQQQITDLKSALSEQKQLVERLETELDEAKKAAIHLAEANAKLGEQINNQKPQQPKAQSIIRPKKYNQTFEKLPQKKSEDSDEGSSQMWLLD